MGLPRLNFRMYHAFLAVRPWQFWQSNIRYLVHHCTVFGYSIRGRSICFADQLASPGTWFLHNTKWCQWCSAPMPLFIVMQNLTFDYQSHIGTHGSYNMSQMYMNVMCKRDMECLCDFIVRFISFLWHCTVMSNTVLWLAMLYIKRFDDIHISEIYLFFLSSYKWVFNSAIVVQNMTLT